MDFYFFRDQLDKLEIVSNKVGIEWSGLQSTLSIECKPDPLVSFAAFAIQNACCPYEALIDGFFGKKIRKFDPVRYLL